MAQNSIFLLFIAKTVGIEADILKDAFPGISELRAIIFLNSVQRLIDPFPISRIVTLLIKRVKLAPCGRTKRSSRTYMSISSSSLLNLFLISS